MASNPHRCSDPRRLLGAERDEHANADRIERVVSAHPRDRRVGSPPTGFVYRNGEERQTYTQGRGWDLADRKIHVPRRYQGHGIHRRRQARRRPHAGEPAVRSVLRDAAGRARVLRSQRPAAERRNDDLPPEQDQPAHGEPAGVVPVPRRRAHHPCRHRGRSRRTCSRSRTRTRPRCRPCRHRVPCRHRGRSHRTCSRSRIRSASRCRAWSPRRQAGRWCWRSPS